MDKVTIYFTKSNTSPISWLIRWALPRSRFALALSSHCLVRVGNQTYDMGFRKKVEKVDWDKAIKGRTIVAVRTFLVPNLQDGLKWAEEQVGKLYDIKGAFGLSIAPDRNWSQDDRWFCYEFAAAFLKACGMDIFHDLSLITETALLSLRSN